MQIAKDMTELIGNTPMVEINKLNTGKGKILAKLEYFNPANSIKDRPAKQIIFDAEKEGKIKKDTLIVEPTSGNMGIGLAMICAIKGYKLILTMPETMSIERRQILRAYGAELVLTPAKEGMQGAVSKAKEIATKNQNSFIPSQFENPSNPKAHEMTTAQEIWNDIGGKIDIFVAGVGTGGTISGCGKFLKSKNPSIKIIAVEPFSSQCLAGLPPSTHKIQGIGANFTPKNYMSKYIDEILPVKDEDAIEMCKLLPKQEGILSGISGGANVWAAVEISKRPENNNKTIITVIPDCADHYLSCDIFD